VATDAEKIEESLSDFLNCLICAAVYCHGPGWEGFREYLDSLNTATGIRHLTGENERADLHKAWLVLKGLMANSSIVRFIVSEVLKERGRAFN
jgi:hypothetical protein